MKITSTAKRLLASLRNRIVILRHRRRLRTLAQEQSAATTYDYLETQLRRTYDKRNAPLQKRTAILIDAIAERAAIAGKDVLCVGCRTTQELHYFHRKGAKSVVGIDLFSEDPSILVMDMHQMTFPDSSFDLIYSSHSLEHAHTPAQVAREMLRVARTNTVVAIEVPIRYQTRGADLIDLQSVDKLQALFAPHIQQVLLQEEHEVDTAANPGGTPIARTIFMTD